MDALDAGHDVMIFSDNVPLARRSRSSAYAAARGLLVMGPDCGTAVLDGVGLGFANAVRPGRSASSPRPAPAASSCSPCSTTPGVGVATALGVGGRDLSADGRRARPPARRCAGSTPTRGRADRGGVQAAGRRGRREHRRTPRRWPPRSSSACSGRGQPRPDRRRRGGAGAARPRRTRLAGHGADTPAPPTGPLLRGLFVGGTLCDESMLIATEALGPIRSNIPLSDDLALGATCPPTPHDGRLR